MNSETGNPILSDQSILDAMGTEKKPAVNWKQVVIFLALTFGLTWLLDLVLFKIGGLTHPAASIMLQLQMLLPAFSAILLGLFFYKNSPLYFRNNRSISRWFVYFYLLLTLAYIGVVVFCTMHPENTTSASQYMLIPAFAGIILLIVLRIIGKREPFAKIGMAGGKPIYWLVMCVGMVLFYGLTMLLNAVFKMGQAVDLQSNPIYAAASAPTWVILLSGGINTIVLGPFLGLIIAFGEEYGWRGYLQGELTKLGRIKGTLLVGIIWGIWHWPLIWMGYNYPGQPVWGSLMMVVFTIFLAFVLAYAVFKARGIWISAYLHALNNQTLSFFVLLVFSIKNPMLNFSAGVPAILLYAVIVLLLLRDPVWKESTKDELTLNASESQQGTENV
jgi:membrane protease YdiL (CAAX protease family)